jgi:acetone carboxylase gamma subunit
VTRSLSATLVVEGEGARAEVACRACAARLGPASGIWKDHAIRRETPLDRVGIAAFDTGAPGVVLRQFFCPGCGALLDTETARPSDPVLVDRLKI